MHQNIHLFLLTIKTPKITGFFFIISITLIGCKHDTPPTQHLKSCNCPIEKLIDQEKGNKREESKNSSETGGGLNLEATIRKIIDSKINITGKIDISDSQVSETYWKILGNNPRLTQYANLYRTVACAYYDIICQDSTLSAKEQTIKLLNIVNGFEENIDKIVRQSEEKSSAGAVKPSKATKEQKVLFSKSYRYRIIDSETKKAIPHASFSSKYHLGKSDEDGIISFSSDIPLPRIFKVIISKDGYRSFDDYIEESQDEPIILISIK